jgi:FkbM family methyltransferase
VTTSTSRFGGGHKGYVRAVSSQVGRVFRRVGGKLDPVPLAAQSSTSLRLDFTYVVGQYILKRNDPRPFFFVQIGAYDGTSFDGIHELARRLGWRGLLVEPQPIAFRKLQEAYAGHEGVVLVNAAINDSCGERQLHLVADVHGQPLEALGGLASFSRFHVQDWLDGDGRRHNPDAAGIASETVRCVTFADLLADVDYVDLLHVDTEGYDLEVLRLFDLERYAPPIVRFEHVHLSRAEWDEAVRLLAGQGYRVLREAHDTTAHNGAASPGQTVARSS